MDTNDVRELSAQVEAIYARDFHLGSLLRQLLIHLGNAHGLVLNTHEAPAAIAPPTALSSDTEKRAATSTQGDN